MDLMIDIETLDTKPTATVLSVGWLLFEPEKTNTFFELLGYTNYSIVQVKSQRAATTSLDTWTWWLGRGDELLRLLTDKTAEPMVTVLNRLVDTCVGEVPARVWANSPSFDLRILEHHFGQFPVPMGLPWPFYRERDLRTLLDVCDVDKRVIKNVGFTAHRADHDAAFQAMLVQIAYAKQRGAGGDPHGT